MAKFLLLVVSCILALGATALELPREDALKELLLRSKTDAAALAKELRESPFSAVLDWTGAVSPRKAPRAAGAALPTVFAHGMGDSCFNSGMKQITADVGTHTGSYSVCVPTGDNVISDTINGFLLDMDKSVDVFAAKIRNDTALAGGFNAVGFSQGNSLIRGYVQKYNSPVVHNYLSVHGTVSGVAGVPQCDPSKSGLCKSLAGVCGSLAYNALVQGILFQADYFRHPGKTDTAAYKEHCQLAKWNNEGDTKDPSINANFAKTDKWVMVKAEGDTMVFPNDGEWWGAFADGDFTTRLAMNETAWYKDDLFGLRTADEAGKIFFESTPGNHLDFTEKQLFGWVDKYFTK